MIAYSYLRYHILSTRTLQRINIISTSEMLRYALAFTMQLNPSNTKSQFASTKLRNAYAPPKVEVTSKILIKLEECDKVPQDWYYFLP